MRPSMDGVPTIITGGSTGVTITIGATKNAGIMTMKTTTIEACPLKAFAS